MPTGYDQLLLLVVSFIANLLSALAGGGAGLVQLPALIFLGLPFPVALATHKLATVALGIGATARHLKSSTLEWRFALFFLLLGLPGVVLGAHIILSVSPQLAQVSLGVLTIGLGIYSHLQTDLGQTFAPQHRDTRGYATGGLVLFGIGVLNGSLTSGTGLFVTVWLVRWFGFDYTRAVAYTLVLVGLFWNGAGALTLGLQGQIAWGWLPMLVAGSLLGGYAGTHLGIVNGNRLVKITFEICALLAGVSLVAKALA